MANPGGGGLPLDGQQIAALAAQVAALLPGLAGGAGGAGDGDSEANRREAQRLADVRLLGPTPGSRTPMPKHVLQLLPADPADLEKGGLPLVPTHQLPLSQALADMASNANPGGARPGSLRHEAAFLVSYACIIDTAKQWLDDYERLAGSVLGGEPALAALLEAPLGGLRYLLAWLAAVVGGRLACIEAFVHNSGGKPALELLDSHLFAGPAAFTFPTAATAAHLAVLNSAQAKQLAKAAAERQVGGGGRGGEGGRGGGRGGRGGRGGGSGGRGGGSGEGSSGGAGAGAP